MNRLDPNRFALAALILLSVIVFGGLGIALYQLNRTWTVTIAAGNRTGESFVLATALKRVAERLHPDLRVIVRETAGTAENISLLESGEVQLATAQMDIPAGPSARLVTMLYSDAFQLLVRQDSSIRSFTDLAGKRIAVPTKGGQFQSFLKVAEHFGLDRSQFAFIEDDESGAGFLAGRADALFRVRALGNPMLTHLARQRHVRLVPIAHAPAMHILIPAFEPAVVPEGAYLGNPAIPAQDTPTVVVHRTLLAHLGTPAEPIRWLTATLMEHREEIAQAIPEEFAEVRPLLASIRKPEDGSGVGAGIHPGALEFYEKDKPSFVQTHADFLALIFSILVLAGSWLWELRRLLDRRQKHHADGYRSRITGLMCKAQASGDLAEVVQIRKDLLNLITQSISDLDSDLLSEKSFESLYAIWKISMNTVRERLSVIQEQQGVGRAS